jgi:hypothetical protein
LYNILNRLKSALNLKEPVDKIKNVYISPEQKAKNKAMTDKINAAVGLVKKNKSRELR